MLAVNSGGVIFRRRALILAITYRRLLFDQRSLVSLAINNPLLSAYLLSLIGSEYLNMAAT